MIVNGKVNAVLFGELVEQVEGIIGRLGHDRLDAHVLGEVEQFAAAVVIKPANPVIHQFDPGIGQFRLDFACERSAVMESLNWPFGMSLLTAWPG